MKKIIIGVIVTFGLGVTGFVSAATSSRIVAGVPIDTFCSVYAKNEATKHVGISLVLKIRENPSLKDSLMRQYATFISLGKIHCKGEYSPPAYNYTKPSASNVIDISDNEPIINTQQNTFTDKEDYFTGYDTNALSGLNSQQLETIKSRIVRGKQKFSEIVDDLISQGRLTEEDKKEMAGKIAFTFSDSCTQLDGKILVRQRYNQYNKPIKNELLSLNITINLCFTYAYSTNYDSFLDRIIYHELAHFYNYFHDLDNSGFTAICREGADNRCNNNDFVSSYARSQPDEDYAETFVWYVYDKKPAATSVMQSKIDYFKIRDPRYK